MSARSPGEKRRRQAKRDRERAAYLTAVTTLRAAGASCATCKHRGARPVGGDGPICELDSDFHGYAPVKMTGLCPSWAQRQS